MSDTPLILSPSPHIRARRSTQTIMAEVLLALLPAAVMSVVFFGLPALCLILTCNLFCGLSEYAAGKLFKYPNTVPDLSCFVTGTLLALSLSPAMGAWKNLWMAAVGSIIAIVVVKMLFGGIGRNFANPAVTARIVLLLCFADVMSETAAPRISFSPELVAGATPLAQIAAGQTDALPSLLDMFLGGHGGAIGETCTLALLVGGIYLIARRIISPITPLAFIGTVGLLTFLGGAQPLYQMMGGGLVLGAFFMATDYTTTPRAPLGKLIFGVGCGVFTSLIRLFGSLPEGVSYAILLMNILTPYIERLTARRPLTGLKKARKAKAAEKEGMK